MGAIKHAAGHADKWASALKVPHCLGDDKHSHITHTLLGSTATTIYTSLQINHFY